jgi:predicted MFS family arabinose efflux permease
MTTAPPPALSPLQQYAVYATGLFTISTSHMAAVAVPVYILTMNPSAFLVGIIVGARGYLPLLLSIHGGALMDRLGVRRVMMFFAVVGVVTALLYPLAVFPILVLLLQLVSGLTENMAWIGGQTLVGQNMKGDPVHAGRLSFATRAGAFVGPPVIGAAWDFLGPWGAFGFFAVWMALLLLSVWVLPKQAATGRPPVRLGELLPNWRDYVTAFKLLAVPAIAVTMAISLLRIGGVAIQSSFYVVYLQDIGMSAALIGTMLAVSNGLAAASSLFTGPFVRWFGEYWTMVATSILAVLFVVVTPLFIAVVPLMICAALRGCSMGISQVLLISVTSKGGGVEAQGTTVGLRSTANTIAYSFLPPVMGGVADLVGLSGSFGVVGVVLIGGILIAGIVGGRRGMSER